MGIGGTGGSLKETTDKAVAILRKSRVFYGDPDDNFSDAPGDDRLLPPELKIRVNKWLYNKMVDLPGFKKEWGGYTSLNAMIRSEIAKGNL